MSHERGPILEPVGLGDQVLRVAQRELIARGAANALDDAIDGAIEAALHEWRDLGVETSRECAQPVARPITNGVGFGRSYGVDELFRAFAVLVEPRARRKRKRIHTKLLE